MTPAQLKERARAVATRAYMAKGAFLQIGPGRQRCIDAAADAVLDLVADYPREQLQQAASSRVEPPIERMPEQR